MGLTPKERQARAQMGGFAAAEKPLEERRANTSAARAAFELRFAQEVISEAIARGEQLDDQELARRADLRRRRYFAKLKLDGLRRARQRREAAIAEALGELPEEPSRPAKEPVPAGVPEKDR